MNVWITKIVGSGNRWVRKLVGREIAGFGLGHPAREQEQGFGAECRRKTASRRKEDEEKDGGRWVGVSSPRAARGSDTPTQRLPVIHAFPGPTIDLIH